MTKKQEAKLVAHLDKLNRHIVRATNAAQKALEELKKMEKEVVNK